MPTFESRHCVKQAWTAPVREIRRRSMDVIAAGVLIGHSGARDLVPGSDSVKYGAASRLKPEDTWLLSE